MNPKKGYCTGSQTHKGCGNWGLLTNLTHRLCIACNKKRLIKSSKEVQKSSGELQVFKEIWKERPHISQISGKPLGEFNVCFFSHVITKGAYPRFRLNKENIILKTFEEHQLWENHQHKIRGLDEWEWVFELKEQLIRKYYGNE